mmetsp:Transcript_106037/g.310087  ORF Transcript_106037/g.310087 Transcript_106037/m.310087 type:complete len:198 (+) Transcript_106037:59-652(+)
MALPALELPRGQVAVEFCKPILEEAPPLPPPTGSDSEDEEDALAPEASLEALPRPAGFEPMPRRVEVSGSHGKAGYPALSPRSGLLKRKDGDHLQLNGTYELQAEPYNGAPVWVKLPSRQPAGDSAPCGAGGGEEPLEEPRALFRAADGSWVLDARPHAAGPEELVAARLRTAAREPTKAPEAWAPLPELRVRALEA